METDLTGREGAEHEGGEGESGGSDETPLELSCDLGMKVLRDDRSWADSYFIGDLDGDGEPDAIDVDAHVILSSAQSSPQAAQGPTAGRVVDVADWTGNGKDDVIIHSAEMGWRRAEITDDGQFSYIPWLPEVAQELPSGAVVLPIQHDSGRTLLFCELRGEVSNQCMILRDVDSAMPRLMRIELDPGDSSLSGSAELIAAGDMNGDGYDDIAVLYFGQVYPMVEYVSVFMGPGFERGVKSRFQDLPPRSEILAMLLEDVDMDGFDDLVLSFGTNLQTDGTMWRVRGSNDMSQHSESVAEVFEQGFARSLDIDGGLMIGTGHFDLTQDGQRQSAALVRLARSDGSVTRELCTQGCFGQLGRVKIWTSPVSNASTVFCHSSEVGVERSNPLRLK